MEKKQTTKRTTIIFDEKDRQYLEQLIKDGKEPGIKPLISKMFDVYRSMAIYDWKFPGEYYCGVSRIAFFSQENLNTLIDLLPKDKLRETGRRVGDAMKVSTQASFNIDPTKRENWLEVLKRLRVFGYGDVICRDKFIIAKNPFIGNLQMLLGFLEGMLGCSLEPRITTSPMVFEVVEKSR